MKYFKFYIITIICFNVVISVFGKSVPTTKDVLTGKLENGLSYYIHTNKHPENKIELRLVVNAGSALETDDQQGLAHFLEHMAFSATKDFPGTSLIDTLESIGVRFGKELNAYTSFDETVYTLPIPSYKFELGIKILANWAMNINFTEANVNRERGVILEEMRLGKGMRTRLQNQYLPVLFEGSPYCNRLPIGKEEVIKNFKKEELADFYKKWYRPNLMSVVIVGDIDKSQAFDLLNKYFKEFTSKYSNEKRPVYFPTVHKNIKTCIAADSEKKNCSVEFICKHPASRNLTEKDFKTYLIDKLYTYILDNRLNALQDSSSVYFSDAEISYRNHFRFIDTYSFFALCEKEDVTKVLKLLFTEHYRVEKNGINSSELDDAKRKLISLYHKWYNEKDNNESESLANNYQTAFLLGQPEPGIEWEYDFVEKTMKSITVKDVLKRHKEYITDQNCVISITGPEYTDYPDNKSIASIMDKSNYKNITSFVSEPEVNSLMNFYPKKGSIINEEFIDSLKLYKYRLSNGCDVLIRNTDYKSDQVLFRATSEGGYSMYKDDEVMSAVNATRIQDESGINSISNRQLSSLMNGKNISITQSIGYYYESMWARSSVKHLEELFQLIYLYHTSPYFRETACNKVIKESKSNFSYLKKTPDSYFDFYCDSIMNGGNFRKSPWPLNEEIDKICLDKAKNIYCDRFGNSSGFTYIFVGNINPDSIKNSLETYIASIPADKSSKSEIVPFVNSYKNDKEKHILKINNQEKSTVKIRYIKSENWDSNMAVAFDAFTEILRSRLFQALRIEMSGVYGVNVSSSIERLNNGEAKLNFTFGCSPEMTDTLISRLNEELIKLYDDGPEIDEINKYQEKYRVELETNKNNNASILTDIYTSVRGRSLPYTYEYKISSINNLNKELIIKSAHKYIDIEKPHIFILLPKEQN